MNEHTIRIFLDSGVHHHEKALSADQSFLPGKSDLLFPDEKTVLSPLARILAIRPSIDGRLREALKPVIDDRTVLKPERYQALMAEAHAAMLQQNRNENEAEVKEAFSHLISLLEDNAGLMSLLDQCMNQVYKA